MLRRRLFLIDQTADQLHPPAHDLAGYQHRGRSLMIETGNATYSAMKARISAGMKPSLMATARCVDSKLLTVMIEPPPVDDLLIQRAKARNCVEDFQNIPTVAYAAQSDRSASLPFRLLAEIAPAPGIGHSVAPLRRFSHEHNVFGE